VDLVLHKPRIRRILEEVLAGFRPQLVGLSAMTFQFDTLTRLARFLRGWDPGMKLAAGGYHPTLMARELVAADPDLPLDFLIRGEGETAFRTCGRLADLTRASRIPDQLPGGAGHNPDRPLLLWRRPLPGVRPAGRTFSSSTSPLTW
jgi:hypothetical protein